MPSVDERCLSAGNLQTRIMSDISQKGGSCVRGKTPIGCECLTVQDREMFSRLGIGSELLARARIERVTDQQAREKFGIICSGDKAGILFPYYDPASGARYTARLRRDRPEIEDGRLRGKYISAYGDR